MGNMEPKLMIDRDGLKAWTFWLSLAVGIVGAVVEVLSLYADELGSRGALALSALGFILAVLRIIKQRVNNHGAGDLGCDRGSDQRDHTGHTPRSGQGRAPGRATGTGPASKEGGRKCS